MKTPIRSIFSVAAFAILILGAGCTGDQQSSANRSDESYGDPVPGGTAVITVGADMTIPLVAVAQGVLDGYLGADVMYMELLRPAWQNGRLVYLPSDQNAMAIARSYEFTDADSTSLRFHLRSDLNWSDGEPIVADDVVYTYEILEDPGLASPVQSYAEFVESVEAVDDSTVVFHFAGRNPEAVFHTSLPILPSHLLAGTAPSELRNHPALRDPANGNLVVSGPYMIGDWVRGSSITLVRNPEFEPAGLLDQIVFRIIPDATTRQVELQTGGVDFVQTLTLDQIPMLRQDSNIRFEVEEKRFYDFIVYNGGQFEAFADPEIRRALGMATDREALLAALQMEEFATVAGGPYPPIFRDLYDPERQAAVPHDPDGAREILAGKGWSDSDGDGTLDKDGQPFRFTLVTNVGNQRRADVTQIIQQQWSRIGVSADIRTIEFNTLNNDLVAGDFEAALYGWSVGLSPDLTPIWSPESPFNFSRYSNPEVSDLIRQARTQSTDVSAAPFWRDAASQIVADQPYTWLYFMDSVDGVNNRLRGTIVNTFGPFQNVWEWWIPAELQR